MNIEPTTAIVLRDDEGTYYLLTPELLAAAWVPTAQVAVLEHAIEAQLDDTTGFAETVHLYNRPGGEEAGLLVVPLDMTAPSLASFGPTPQL
jgi:hypothetical protein